MVPAVHLPCEGRCRVGPPVAGGVLEVGGWVCIYGLGRCGMGTIHEAGHIGHAIFQQGARVWLDNRVVLSSRPSGAIEGSQVQIVLRLPSSTTGSRTPLVLI